MELSAVEKRFVSQQIKAERMWPVMRWLVLLTGIAIFIAGTVIQMAILAKWYGRAGGISIEAPFEQDVFWVMMGGGVLTAAFALLHWRGDPGLPCYSNWSSRMSGKQPKRGPSPQPRPRSDPSSRISFGFRPSGFGLRSSPALHPS